MTSRFLEEIPENFEIFLENKNWVESIKKNFKNQVWIIIHEKNEKIVGVLLYRYFINIFNQF